MSFGKTRYAFFTSCWDRAAFLLRWTGGLARQTLFYKTEPKKWCSAFVWLDKRKVLGSNASTNKFQNEVFVEFVHFEIFFKHLCVVQLLIFFLNLNSMENITECTGLEFKSEYSISNIVICSLVFMTSLYILVALVYHEIRVKKTNQIGFLHLRIEKRYSVVSRYICISIAIASLVLYIGLVSFWSVIGIASFIGSNQTAVETACMVVPPIVNVAITGGNGLVYSFLWLRQRIIYVHPSLKVLDYKYVSKVFSFVVLILWILFWISFLIAYFIKVRYKLNGKSGCVIERNSFRPFNELVFAWTAASILMQVSLLSLFIYPILKRARWRDQQNNPNLMRRVKKAVVFSSICLVTDIATIVVYSIFTTECVINRAIWVYGMNLLINHLITIGCFDHWKKLLWPWKVRSCGIVSAESDSAETIPAASFSASHSQSQLTSTT